MDWLKKAGSEDQFLNMLKKDWDSGKANKVSKLKQQEILGHIHQATLKSRNSLKGKQVFHYFLKFGKVAATFLLFLFSGYFLYEAIVFKDNETAVAEIPVTKITKQTAAGEKLRLTLPDRSEVIVNSLSTLNFSSDFGSNNREIELEGEAFFSVAPDKNKPFKVKTGTVVTTALGTAFNAYAREEEVKISLTEGSVHVAQKAEEISLLPGEMASVRFDAVSGLTKGTFDPDRTTLWKEGKIRFQSKPLREILQSLETWYGVRFETKAFDNRKVTGLFNNESLEDILTGLSFSLGFEYQIDQKNVVIKF
ncbi:MAG: FecR domain-containing protein [Cyclobacterium sp.]|nr:FecR domain-containing protein [Cyclobacterium sp.]